MSENKPLIRIRNADGSTMAIPAFQGPPGVTFTPSVDKETGIISWTNNGSEGQFENPESVNILGPQAIYIGAEEPPADSDYLVWVDDDQREKEPIYFTPSVSANGVISWTNNGGDGQYENPAPVSIKGVKGDTGNGIDNVKQTTISTEDDGQNVLTITLTDGTTYDFVVENGSTGNGIAKIEQTAVSTEDNGINTVTITMTDGTSVSFDVRNGSKGSKGDKGDTGDDGVSVVSVEQTKSSEVSGEDNEFTITLSNGNTSVFTVKNGAKGDTGAGFVVRGYYETVGALSAAITSPETGDAYGVGTVAPYDIYIWDGVNAEWVNNGHLQGANGKDGADGKDGVDGAPGPNEVVVGTTTNITGLLKGNGSVVSEAVVGVDYAATDVAESHTNRNTAFNVADTNYGTIMGRGIYFGTEDMVAGETELLSGAIYLVYE